MIGILATPGTLSATTVVISTNSVVDGSATYDFSFTTINVVNTGSKISIECPSEIDITSSDIVWTLLANALGQKIVTRD